MTHRLLSRLPSPLLLLSLALPLILGCPTARAEDNLVDNPGFEDGDSGWRLFVPPDSTEKGCAMEISTTSPHGGGMCIEIHSDVPARYALCVKKLQDGPIIAGERARLTFWVRAGADLKTTKLPEFMVRIFMSDESGNNLPNNEALFVGLNGKTTVQPSNSNLDLSGLENKGLTPSWQKVEAVFEIPKDLAQAHHFNAPEFFAQNTSGSIDLDDVSLERVGLKVPLSPSIKKP